MRVGFAPYETLGGTSNAGMSIKDGDCLESKSGFASTIQVVTSKMKDKSSALGDLRILAVCSLRMSNKMEFSRKPSSA